MNFLGKCEYFNGNYLNTSCFNVNFLVGSNLSIYYTIIATDGLIRIHFEGQVHQKDKIC